MYCRYIVTRGRRRSRMPRNKWMEGVQEGMAGSGLREEDWRKAAFDETPIKVKQSFYETEKVLKYNTGCQERKEGDATLQ